MNWQTCVFHIVLLVAPITHAADDFPTTNADVVPSPNPTAAVVPLVSDQTAGNSSRPTITARGRFLYGPVRGFLQTPAGGSPATTNIRRPRLGELGISTATIGQGEVAVGWEHQELFASAEVIGLSGDQTLRNDLTSHGVTFPAATSVSSNVSLDYYRVGYRYRFQFREAANGQPQFTVSPYADGLLWNFDYTLRGNGERVTRGYLKPSVQLGAQGQWRPAGGRFSLDADLSSCPPGISSLPFIAAVEATANYRFLETSRLEVAGSLGVRFERIDYHDTQRISNHIRADMGPMLLVGIAIKL